MIKSFFLVTLRNLKRQKIYSLVNILGLSVGLTCSILILLWVQDEVNYDSNIPNKDHLHQVWMNVHRSNSIDSYNSLPFPIYNALKEADNNIKKTCLSGYGGNRLISSEDKRVIKRGYFVTEEFLEVFEFPLKEGSREEVLQNPNSIVISESLAEFFFDSANPIGQTLRLENKGPLQITGVLRDIPGNSSFQFDYLIPWENKVVTGDWDSKNRNNWGNYVYQVYVELHDESKFTETEIAIKDILKQNGQDFVPRYLFLHPLPKWRLYSNFEGGVAKAGMAEYVNLFSLIAIAILLIACINFMNLTTARSQKRAREVGLRKTMGSSKKQLVVQFVGESLLIALFSYFLALIFTTSLLPNFNQMVDKELMIDFTSLSFWGLSAVIVVVTGVIAGSYPAFYLSRFKPINALKGTFKTGKNSFRFRKVLVTLQFCISFIMIASTIIIAQQIRHVQDRDLGYEQDRLISIDYSEDLEKNFNVLKRELIESGAVQSITRSNSSIADIVSSNYVSWPNKADDQKILFTTITTGYDYAKTMQIDVLQGRDFSPEFTSDSSAIIVNKAAIDLMNLDDPLGTNLELWGQKRRLIGVVDNTLMGSPFDEVQPAFMILSPPRWVSDISIRLSENNSLQSNLQTVQGIFEKYNPTYPFEYEFVDVEFERKFAIINLTKRLAIVFAILALVITGLGLFGLSAYAAEQRIKEIGIRKVLGATVSNILRIMSTDFSRLALIAFVVAAPISWYLLDNYLDKYSIRIDISWWIFPLIGLCVWLFSIVVISNQAWRAAVSNPIDSLRDE